MGRNANGEGTFTKLPSGKYRARFVDVVNGVTVRKSFTSTSPSACRKAHNEWLQSENKVAIEKVKTVEQWARHWLEVYKIPYVSWKVGKDYEMYVDKHILPAIIDGTKFGSLKLSDVRPAHIAKLYAGAKGKNGQMSATGYNYIKICLRGIFETAIDNNLCIKNPAARVSPPEVPQKQVSAFTKNQMKNIIEYMPLHVYGAYIAMLMYTGLRVGEMLALMWTDIDFDNSVIHVRRTLTRDANGIVIGQTTKTQTERVIPFDDVLKGFIGKINKTGIYVVSKDNGEHHTHKTFERIYYSFFNDLNSTIENDNDRIPRMSPHKCRHTFATYLLRSGTDIRYVQALLGHTTIKTTEIYTEVNVDDLKTNIAKLSFK